MNTCIFSPDRAHRYTLLHVIDELEFKPAPKIIAWIGHNPSVANEEKLDNTLRRVRYFTTKFGGNAFLMLNLFGFVATDPQVMVKAHKAGADIIGPDNDRHISTAAGVCIEVVACWGGLSRFMPSRVDEVRRIFDRPLKCLGRTINNEPLHPLYQPNSRALQIL